MAATRRSRKHKIIDVNPATGKELPPAAPEAPALNNMLTLAQTTGADTGGYFQRVRSNLKGRQIDVPLSGATAIVSAQNRVGKTAVLDAIRLALTGKHPIGPHAADLVGLTVGGAMPFAELTGPKAGAGFSFPSGRKTPTLDGTYDFAQLSTDERAELLPLSTWADLLTLGTAKAREELFRRFGPQDATPLNPASAPPLIPPPSISALTETQLVRWNRALSEAATGATGIVDRLASAGTVMRKLKLALSSRLKGLEEEKARLSAAQLASGVGGASDGLLQEVEKKIAAHHAHAQMGELQGRMLPQAESRLTNAINELTKLCEGRQVDDIIADLTTTKTHLKDKLRKHFDIERLEHEVGQASAANAETKKQLQIFKLVEQLQGLLPTHGCFVCGQAPHHAGPVSVGNVKQMIDQLEQALAASVEQRCIQSLRSAQEQFDAQYSEGMRNLEYTRQILDTRINEVRQAKAAYDAVQASVSTTQQAALPSEPLEVLQQQRNELIAAKQQDAHGAQLSAEIRGVQMDQLDAAAVESALTLLLNQLIKTVQTEAENAVNRWMPPGFTAVLSLQDADEKPECSWCVRGSDGRAHPLGAMSGAERAALTVAIACAWSEQQKFRFLLLDDSDIAGFNPENLAAMLTMVAEAVKTGRLTQAFVAWSRPGEIPLTGWSVVSL